MTGRVNWRRVGQVYRQELMESCPGACLLARRFVAPPAAEVGEPDPQNSAPRGIPADYEEPEVASDADRKRLGGEATQIDGRIVCRTARKGPDRPPRPEPIPRD